MDLRHRARLSSSAEELESRLARRPGGEAFDCDLLIVGSGYGGAVAAARLAGRTPLAAPASGHAPPLRVWVLERGQERPPGSFPSRFAEVPGDTRWRTPGAPEARGADEGLFDWHLGSDVSALVASGLGGGSLINAGVMARPDDAVWNDGWPQGIREELDAAFEAAEAMLQPRVVPLARRTAKFEALANLAQSPDDPQPCRLTLNPGRSPLVTPAGVALAPCTRCGDCASGCNVGAKGSLDTQYLALARQRGAEFFCGAEALSIEPLQPGCPDAGWSLQWRYTRKSTRAVQRHTVVKARRVILAAGTLGSTGIVMRSRQALGLDFGPDRPLGQRFSGNGDGIFALVDLPDRVGAVADPESDPALAQPDRSVGPTITGQLRFEATAESPAFVVQDFAIPAALRGVMAEITSSRDLFVLPGEHDVEGMDPFAARDAALERTAVFGLIGDDGAAGTLVLDSDAPGAAPRVVWPADRRPHAARRAIEAALEQRLDERRPAGLPSSAGPRLLHGSSALRYGADQEPLPMVTVHPLGGLCMADDGHRGVVNAIGQVFRGAGTEVLDGLCVLDGSIVPRALGLNPALTITALAERAVQRLAAQWGLGGEAAGAAPADAATAALASPRPRGERRHEIASGPPSWVMSEIQQGALELDGRHWWARLRVRSEPLPGFATALQLDRRVLALQSATLWLHGPLDAAPDEFTLDDRALERPDAQVQLSGSVLLLEPLPGGDELARAADRIVYRLVIQAVGPGLPAAFRPGVRLEGVKTVHRLPVPDTQLWRALTEMTLALDGRPVGRLSLDLADQERRASLLVQATQLANLPDALADLGTAGLYILRRGWRWMLPSLAGDLGGAAAVDPIESARQRWPTDIPLGDGRTVVAEIDHPETEEAPWRLTRYQPPGPTAGAAAAAAAQANPPVLLIHGLGMSGVGFTHPSLPCGLARHLLEQGRPVWVLDLRSSIANEAWRSRPEAAGSTVEQVATADIPAAVAWACRQSGVDRLDVIAHCMGAVSFILAALAPGNPMGGRIRRVVLSQVSPLVRLGAANRLRARVLGPLRQWLPVDELDATPTVRFDPASQSLQSQPAGALLPLLDAALGVFPYGTQDETPATVDAANRRIRLRADAIYGQLFEGGNLHPQTWTVMAALFGWTKVSMLSQALDLLRLGLVGDRVNRVLRHGAMATQFDFPLLVLQGQRNRVFDWRGSLEGWKLMCRLRGLNAEAAPDLRPTHRLHGAGTSTRLAVFPAYGHLDSLIGERAARDVFPVVDDFLASPLDDDGGLRALLQPPEARRAPPVEAEALDLGPMMGWLSSRIGRDGDQWLDLTLGVHLTPRRASTVGLALVPIVDADGRSSADLDRARWLPWPGPRTLDTLADRHQALRVRLRASALKSLGPRFAVLSLHRDLPLRPPPAWNAAPGLLPELHYKRAPLDLGDWTPPEDPEAIAITDEDGNAEPEDWLAGGGPLFPGTRQGVQAWLEAQPGARVPPAVCFELGLRAQRAADIGRAYPSSPSLCFALASCQYPPGLFDREPAQATLAALAADARSADGPQFVLLVGDQVYADADGGVFDPAAGAPAAGLVPTRFEHAYQAAWSLPAWRAVSQRLPVLPMLDDHEVRDHWQGRRGRSDAQLSDEEREGLQAYQRLQGVLAPPTRLCPDSGAQSYTLAPGGVPLCVLDTRSQRDSRQVDTLGDSDLLGPGEFKALTDWLDGCERGAVKLLVSSVTLLPPPRLGHPAQALLQDGWAGFPGRSAALLKHIRSRNIRGVVLLSGDVHLSSVSRWRFSGDEAAPQILSVVSSGLYAPFPFANSVPADARLDAAEEIAFEAPGTAPVRGRLDALALHAGPSYARVRIVPARPGGAGAVLEVSLCSPRGDVHCRVPLDLPDPGSSPGEKRLPFPSTPPPP